MSEDFEELAKENQRLQNQLRIVVRFFIDCEES